jgi:hypothetical protein
MQLDKTNNIHMVLHNCITAPAHAMQCKSNVFVSVGVIKRARLGFNIAAKFIQ